MTKQDYENLVRSFLVPYPEMVRTSEKMETIFRAFYPTLFGVGHTHPCELCGVTCKVAASYNFGDTMVQHRAPCGALCGRGLYHGDNPHFATSCPNCNPGRVEGDSGPTK